MSKLNPKTDTPKNKRELTKDFMLGYIKVNGTDADKKWYKELCYANKITKNSSLPKS